MSNFLNRLNAKMNRCLVNRLLGQAPTERVITPPPHNIIINRTPPTQHARPTPRRPRHCPVLLARARASDPRLPTTTRRETRLPRGPPKQVRPPRGSPNPTEASRAPAQTLRREQTPEPEEEEEEQEQEQGLLTLVHPVGPDRRSCGGRGGALPRTAAPTAGRRCHHRRVGIRSPPPRPTGDQSVGAAAAAPAPRARGGRLSLARKRERASSGRRERERWKRNERNQASPLGQPVVLFLLSRPASCFFSPRGRALPLRQLPNHPPSQLGPPLGAPSGCTQTSVTDGPKGATSP